MTKSKSKYLWMTIVFFYCSVSKAQTLEPDISFDAVVSMQLQQQKPKRISLMNKLLLQNKLEMSQRQRKQIVELRNEIHSWQIQILKEQAKKDSDKKKAMELKKRIEENRSELLKTLLPVQRKELNRVFANYISANSPAKIYALASNPETAKILGLSKGDSERLGEKWKKLDVQRIEAIKKINRRFDERLLRELPKKSQIIAKGWLKRT